MKDRDFPYSWHLDGPEAIGKGRQVMTRLGQTAQVKNSHRSFMNGFRAKQGLAKIEAAMKRKGQPEQ